MKMHEYPPVWRAVMFAIHEAENEGIPFTDLIWLNGKPCPMSLWLH